MLPREAPGAPPASRDKYGSWVRPLATFTELRAVRRDPDYECANLRALSTFDFKGLRVHLQLQESHMGAQQTAEIR